MPGQIHPRFQCRHIFTEGRRCAAACLRGEPLCYFHQTNRPPTRRSQAHPEAFTLPHPEDRAAIQLAVGQIIDKIAACELDNRRAGLLLYALQIASANLPKTPSRPAQQVEEVTHHETLGPLAPEAQLDDSARALTEAFLATMLSADDEEEELSADDEEEDQILPEIQAAAAPREAPGMRSIAGPASGRTRRFSSLKPLPHPHSTTASSRRVRYSASPGVWFHGSAWSHACPRSSRSNPHVRTPGTHADEPNAFQPRDTPRTHSRNASRPARSPSHARKPSRTPWGLPSRPL